MKKKVLWIIGIIALLLLVGIAFIIKQTTGEVNDKKDGYDTYEVKEESPLNISGKAAPTKIKTYNNNDQLGDFVSTVVEDGQKVKQGDQLINYNINDQKRQNSQEKVDESQKKVDQDYQNINQQPNNNDLQKTLSKDLDILNDTQKQLSKYNSQVNESMYASFDGKVEMDNDNEANSGEPILKLVSDEAQIKTSISEFDINKIKIGDSVDISVSSTGGEGKGKVTKISELPTSYEDKSQESTMGASESEGETPETSNPTAHNPSVGKDNSKYQVTVGKINIPIRSGFSTEGKIPLDAIKLPKSVLTKGNHVFVLDKNNKVEKRHINITRQNGEIFVEKGLNSGEKLIVSPKKTLNNSEKVEVSS
ncbi:efflux RND transporter periplasmic adaptor subunit [Mammaliicoccus fleurettii]|uniref:efflux RND transporter periplasmic adaptor subunit n=1 Tax=Mammaliicoccus fleurettii TaxID=150056 RepID=UPI002DB5B50D|nr:efflux RND transporter periplasmic adaptor subunit [Mammaliicoccus fleurettii]MEB7781253.1 efflux RND transporter periplasmic adaptor subunit [Mammaliicoccus fleurettii]